MRYWSVNLLKSKLSSLSSTAVGSVVKNFNTVLWLTEQHMVVLLHLGFRKVVTLDPEEDYADSCIIDEPLSSAYMPLPSSFIGRKVDKILIRCWAGMANQGYPPEQIILK